MRFLLELAVFHSIKPWHNGCLQWSHEQKIDIPMIAFKVSGSSVRVYGGLSGSRSPDSGHGKEAKKNEAGDRPNLRCLPVYSQEID